METRFSIAAVLLALLVCGPTQLSAQRLDQFSLKRWKKLRETERYQLQIAEKYYRGKKWKIAAAEYEKYLRLYEESEAAAYAQLKWSLCQVNLRKSNTAIKEGFQSVIDYWPDSTEAIAASYYIGNTYRGMGQLKKARSAYKKVIAKHPKHIVGIYSLNDLVDIATVQKDWDTRAQIWKKLTFDIKRNKANRRVCIRAAEQLTSYHFFQAAFDEGVKALATSRPKEQMPENVVYYVRSPLQQLARDTKTKEKSRELAEQAVAYLRNSLPAADSTDNKKRARQIWFLMADVYQHASLVKQERKIFADIAAKLGTEDDLLASLANWYKRQNNRDQARATYRRYKNRIAGLGQVAYSYREERKPDFAARIYRQLSGMEKEKEDQVKWIAEIGASYRYARKYKQAIDIYQELLKVDAANTQKWLFAMGDAYQAWGKYKLAIGQYRQCTNFPENYKRMAWCHRRLKQHREAIALYGQVSSHASSAPWSLLQIAYTYEEARQKESAIKSFQRVCKRFPKDRHASMAHAHLQTKYKISVTLGGAKAK